MKHIIAIITDTGQLAFFLIKGDFYTGTAEEQITLLLFHHLKQRFFR